MEYLKILGWISGGLCVTVLVIWAIYYLRVALVDKAYEEFLNGEDVSEKD